MKSTTHRRHGNSAWLLAVILTGRVFGAEPTPIRLAVGPFFAPEGNQRLREVSVMLPDLLTAELSRQGRFELVERDKVSAILNELNLTAEGLTSSETVSKLGQMLACDQLVSGSFVVSETHTQVWVKVIDTRTSVVLDLETVTYETTNLSGTVISMVAFLSKAVSRPQARQFIALGRFVDMSISSGREDWARRLRAVIEKRFHEAGFGVVEREAAKPIIEEFQLEGTGLTGSYSNRVRLQPAFWFVDGGCKWVRDTQDKVSVAVRVRRGGYKEQVFRFTRPPGSGLEDATLETIQRVVADTNQIPIQRSRIEEAAIHARLGMESATRNPVLSSSRYSTDPDADRNNKVEDNRRATFESFEKALLLDPNNLLAKRMRFLIRLDSEDASDRKHATNLLQEMAASDNPILAEEARIYLTNSHPTLAHFEKALQFDPDDIMAKHQVAYGLLYDKILSRRERGTNLLRELAALNDHYFAPVARQYLMNSSEYAPELRMPTHTVLTNDPLQKPIQIPTHWAHVDWFSGVTAIKMEQEGLLVATGNILYRVNPGRGEKETINLPAGMKNPITAIASDKAAWWLGTLGGGLIQINKSDNASRVYGEKEGLLASSISSLCLLNDRLWIGFGFRESGGFGYLDLSANKFVGSTSEIGLFKSVEELLQGPPGSRVTAIKTADEKALWIASSWAFHRFDIASQKWSVALPVGPVCASGFYPIKSDKNRSLSQELPRYACLTVNSNFVAVGMSEGGAMVCKLAGNEWSRINLASDYLENKTVSMHMDSQNQRLLWVGGYRKISVIDVATAKIVGVCNLVGLDDVFWIFVERDFVVFAAADRTSRSCGVYWLERPSLLVDRGGER